MADPLKEYQKEIIARGLGSAFQEEGIGRGPLDYRNPQLTSDIAKINKSISGTNSQYKKNMGLAEIQDLLQIGEQRIADDLSPKGLADAYKRMLSNQKSGFTDIIRDQQGNIIGGGNPLFKSPENLLSKKRRDKLREQDLSRISAMPSDSAAFEMSGLDQIAEQLNRAEIPISSPKSDELVRNEEKRKKDAEDFRAKEQALIDSQGGLRSQPIVGQGQDNNPNEDASTTAFLSSMDEFINSARDAAPYKPTERSIKEYKRAFAEATGIDISGKPDKSSALMALGLALMQNRAGSGFNVGNILRAVGQAGEAALPKLEAAKKEAKNNAIAAGKYALEAQAADKATDTANLEKQLNRPGYYIFERGTDIEDGNKKFKDGKIVYLNPKELNELITNPDFDERFSFIEKSEYIDVMKELSKPVELGEMWVKGDPKAFSLIGGDAKDVPPALQVLSHAKNPNYKGETPSRRLLAEEDEDVKNRFVRYQTDIAKNTQKLDELIKNLQAGVSFPKQIADTVKQIGKSLGLNVDTSTTAKAKQELANIAIDNVLEILKESGRTISEGERKRAEKRVSKVDLSLEGSDLDLILNQVEYVYNMVVTNAQKNLDTALDSFENQFGYSVMPKISQEELDAINAKREEDGLEPRKMSDF